MVDSPAERATGVKPAFIEQIHLLDSLDPALVEKVARFIDDLRPFEGERVSEVEEAVADMLVQDLSEADRRLRTELARTVASTRPPQLPADVDPEEIRLALFAEAWDKGLAPGLREDDLFAVHPETIVGAVAARFCIDTDQLSRAMFADTPAERQLIFPAGVREDVARDAIAGLNLERLRRGLRRTVRLTLEIPSRTEGGISYVNLLWGAKRLGLMYEVYEEGRSLILDVYGPYTLFGRTTMYGNRLFDFVLQVLENAGNQWRLKADVLDGGRSESLRTVRLDSSMRHLLARVHDQPSTGVRSGDEDAFQKYFSKLSVSWHLSYEGALVPLGEAGRRMLMVPDFVARCPSADVEVFIEIVGFWKREYLEKKIEKIRLLGNRHMILVVNAKLSVSREQLSVSGTDKIRVLFYSGREGLKRAAENIAEELHRIADGDTRPIS